MNRIVGKECPKFKMQAVTGDGQNFMEIRTEDYHGKWLVMFFYPLDFTFVCPTEITAFSKRAADFGANGAELLAVSCDSVYSHQAWINGDLGKLEFPMASDITKEVARDFGVLIDEEGISLRGLFIINPEGEIKYSVIHDLNVGRSVDETIRVLKALKSGGLCPIDWQEGEDLL